MLAPSGSGLGRDVGSRMRLCAAEKFSTATWRLEIAVTSRLS